MTKIDGDACYTRAKETLPTYGWPDAFRAEDWRRDIGGLLQLWTKEAEDKWRKEGHMADQERELNERLLRVNM